MVVRVDNQVLCPTMVVAVVLVDLYGIQDLMYLRVVTQLLLGKVVHKPLLDLVIDKVMMVQTQLHLD